MVRIGLAARACGSGNGQSPSNSVIQGQSSAWGTVGLGRKAGLGGRGQSRTDGVQYDRGAGKKGGIRAGQKCK